jgi:hypothetical protein
MEKTMRRFTLLLLVVLLGGTDRLMTQENVETRGVTSAVKLEVPSRVLALADEVME